MGIFLLGCGEMGTITGTDLLETYEGDLAFADREIGRAQKLAQRYPKRKVKTFSVDVRDKKALVKALKDSKATVLINAVNYYFNLDIMSACLEAGVDYLDLGGMFHTTLKQLGLDRAFKGKDLVAIPGMGSSPGITNALASYAAEGMERVKTIDVSFADKDYTAYKTPIVLPYTILTLFEEFGYKPVIFKDGKYEQLEPLSGEVDKRFPRPLGSARCFFTLHSEAATLPTSFKGVENCWFRGSFDPGLVDKIRFLMAIGFESREEVRLADGKTVIPRDVIVKMTEKFIPSSDVKIDDTEFLRVEVEGMQNGKSKKVVAYCQSFTNKKWNIAAGSWDTGVAPSVVAQMIADGKVKVRGVVPPELAFKAEELFSGLEKRNMKIWLDKP
jgi:saccharopine dehydrogenase-like NADP-dependent oxidoreductase